MGAALGDRRVGVPSLGSFAFSAPSLGYSGYLLF